MKARNMALCGMFTAVLTVCAWLSIPMGDLVISLQTFGIFLTLGLLGGRRGSIAIFVYLLLGAVGLPVFSGFRGGVGHLIGVTGGFLWGFLISGLVYWALERFRRVPAMIAGLLACYGCGCLWFCFYSGGGIGLILLRCVVPFLIPDLVKLYLAGSLARRLRKVINIPSRT